MGPCHITTIRHSAIDHTTIGRATICRR